MADYSAVGTGALGGAATGATVGSAGGPVGTVIGAGIGAIAGGAAGWIQSNAQQQALAAQQASSAAAIQLQRDIWNQQQQMEAPWLAAGQAALPQLQKIAAGAGNINPMSDPGYKTVSGLQNPGQFQFSTTGPNADPSYQWRLDQGLNAVNSSAAAQGGFFSGNTGKALMDYGQGSASQEYQNQFGRYQSELSDYMNQEQFNSNEYNQAYNRQMGIEQNQYNQFAGLAGIGQTAVNQIGQSGQNYASNVGNIGINQGNNAANASINQGNIWSGAVTNAYNQGISGWGMQQQINAMNQNPSLYANNQGSNWQNPNQLGNASLGDMGYGTGGY